MTDKKATAQPGKRLAWREGRLVVAVGASRSGKTAWVKQQLKNYGAVLVWDVEENYDGVRAGNRRALLAGCERLARGENFTLCYTGQLADFGYWAECAFWLARQREKNPQRLAVVAEELADVTTPGKAPDGWGVLVRRGLKRGVDIYAITQRPSESDKTIMGNASIIHCCGLQRFNDRKYMAQEMDVPVSELETLVRDSDNSRVEYLHKDMRTLKVERAFLKF